MLCNLISTSLHLGLCKNMAAEVRIGTIIFVERFQDINGLTGWRQDIHILTCMEQYCAIHMRSITIDTSSKQKKQNDFCSPT